MFREYDIRGMYGREINGKLAEKIGHSMSKLTSAFALGMDMRRTSNVLFKRVVRGSECKIMNAGKVPTPLLAFVCKKFKVPGVMITASHNPLHYNGFKFFSQEGRCLSRDERKVDGMLLNEHKYKFKKRAKLVNVDALSVYTGEFPKKRLNFKVLVDHGNGCAKVMMSFFGKIFSDVLEIPYKKLSPDPEKRVKKVRKYVKELRPEVCLSFDGDADRLLLFDEDGRVVNPNKIMMFFARNVKSMVANWEASEELERLTKVYRSDSGDSKVSKEMKRKKAELGAETSGHYQWYGWLPYSDPFLTSYRLLSSIKGKNVSEVFEGLKVGITKRFNLGVEKWGSLIETLSSASKSRVEIGKGFKFFFEHGWVVARLSGTESAVRVTAYSKDAKGMRKILKRTALAKF